MLTEEEFNEIARCIEVYIQSNKSYKECIMCGYFSERWREAYREYCESVVNSTLLTVGTKERQ